MRSRASLSALEMASCEVSPTPLACTPSAILIKLHSRALIFFSNCFAFSVGAKYHASWNARAVTIDAICHAPQVTLAESVRRASQTLRAGEDDLLIRRHVFTVAMNPERHFKGGGMVGITIHAGQDFIIRISARMLLPFWEMHPQPRQRELNRRRMSRSWRSSELPDTSGAPWPATQTPTCRAYADRKEVTRGLHCESRAAPRSHRMPSARCIPSRRVTRKTICEL